MTIQSTDKAKTHSNERRGAALVFGGSGAIGAAICRSLAEAGSDVALSYRSNLESAEKVAASIQSAGRRSLALSTDLEEPASVRAAVDETLRQFGSIHSLVYAAGPAIEFLYINQIKPEEWARVMATDINGCFNAIQAVLPHMRESGEGAIVAIVTGAVDRAPPRDILSAVPKAAIQMLIRGVAREEGRSGIRANCVGPGLIDAGLGISTVHTHTADYVERMKKAIPLKRAGTPEDVADAVCFLLSDKARYITGSTIAVAGGLQLA